MNARTTRRAYRVRGWDPDRDLAGVLSLLERTMSGGPTGERTADFFLWKHRANPFDRSHAVVAELDGDLIGFRTFMRWDFAVGDRVMKAVRAVDTATHPDHQGKGIFTELTRTALQDLPDDVRFVFNTPNARSMPGYLKMGWKAVGAMPVAIRPLRPVRFLRLAHQARRAPPRSGSSPSCRLPPVGPTLEGHDVDALLAQTHQPGGMLQTPRTRAYLRWRYAEAPGLDYRAVPLTEGHELVGLAIGRARWRGGLAEFTLSETLVRAGDRRTIRRLLRAVARSGCDHVAAHLAPGSELARQGRAAGYLTAPGLGITMIANPRRTTAPDPLMPRSWYLSLGDLEVF